LTLLFGQHLPFEFSSPFGQQIPREQCSPCLQQSAPHRVVPFVQMQSPATHVSVSVQHFAFFVFALMQHDCVGGQQLTALSRPASQTFQSRSQHSPFFEFRQTAPSLQQPPRPHRLGPGQGTHSPLSQISSGLQHTSPHLRPRGHVVHLLAEGSE
jgi:hypothetical protein